MAGTTTLVMRGGAIDRPSVACPHCKLGHVVEESSFLAYFTGTRIECAECGTPISLWSGVVSSLVEMPRMGNPLLLAGAQLTLRFRIPLNAHEWTDVDLTEAGMPENAQILAIHLSSMGGPFPMLMLGHEPLNGSLRPRFRVFGATGLFPGNKDNGVFGLLAAWHVPGNSDAALNFLVEAARAYHDARHDAVVVPASVAAEVSLTPIVARILRHFSKPESRFTHAQNLNVLLAVAAHLVGAPPIAEEVRSQLRRLNTFRNDVMHRGEVLEHTQQQAAENLSAAVFAVRYSRFLESRIVSLAPST